ncbi:MAG: membrane protein insertion efficiency factor YidD [Bacteroidales bacterium]|nr:membrane protein insertion efficiency factor YidD [Bacteroidales bacterium]
MTLKKILCTTILLLISLSLVSQEKTSIEQFENLFSSKQAKKDYKSYISYKNEIQEISSILFFAYKSLISSQDIANCAFTPSCSVFAIEAIQKKGSIKGLLMATDRLMRCHKFSPELYTISRESGLFIDPVK